MKTIALTSSALALLLSASCATAQAPPDEHAGHHPEAATSPTPVPQVTKTSESTIMGGMQDLMAKIHATKDPAERTRLLQQHSKAMQDQMQKMSQMSGAMPNMDMKMGGMNASGNSSSNPDGGSPMGGGMMNQMMMNHQAMQRRMEMMEMMMGQMMQHQEAQEAAKPAR